MSTGGAVSMFGPVTLRPIAADDAYRVGRFLNQHLNGRISIRSWVEAMVPTWHGVSPNHGYMLLADDQVVGVQLAFYSERQTELGRERICNLAALCVREDHRRHSLRLLMAVLSQRGYSFTDLSPSGNVRPLNLRLGFQQLDTDTALVPNVAFSISPRRAEVVSDRAKIAESLDGADLDIFRDHLAAQAAHHLVLRRGDRKCYLIFRRDRRSNLPWFATILYVSDPELFRQAGGHVFRHLLLRHGIPFTLVELRVARYRPTPSPLLRAHRPKMFLSDRLRPQAIDYLYSELTCVAW